MQMPSRYLLLIFSYAFFDKSVVVLTDCKTLRYISETSIT